MLTVYPTGRSRGILRFEEGEYPCALGRGGTRGAKREGDGATPIGTFFLRQAFYRPDRLAPPASGLLVRALTRGDGWCDYPGHSEYNRLIRLPFGASHENLWRADNLYDGNFPSLRHRRFCAHRRLYRPGPRNPDWIIAPAYARYGAARSGARGSGSLTGLPGSEHAGADAYMRGPQRYRGLEVGRHAHA